MNSNCPDCDRPAGWDTACVWHPPGCECNDCQNACWGGSQCQSAAVNWRERALAAESAAPQGVQEISLGHCFMCNSKAFYAEDPEDARQAAQAEADRCHTETPDLTFKVYGLKAYLHDLLWRCQD